MASRPLVHNGTYRIKSPSTNTYLECTDTQYTIDDFVVMSSNSGTVTTAQQSPSTNTYLECADIPYTVEGFVVTMGRNSSTTAQQWTISSAGDTGYEIKSVANGYRLSVNNQNELVCTSTGLVIWNIDPRGSDAYAIGNASNALAIQHHTNGPVTVAIPNNGAHQRWTFEIASVPSIRHPNPLFNDDLKVSRLTVTEPELRKHNESWLLVHKNAGPYLVQYIVTGNCSSCAGPLPVAAAIMIDILAVKKSPSCPDDVYLPSIGGYHAGHRGMVVDPTKAGLIYRHTKDIPHAGVWSLGVPPVNNEIHGRTLSGDEVIACYVHCWTSHNQAVRLWVDCALYYTD